MLTELTKKQKELKAKKREEWINTALYNQNFDKEELEAGVKWLYYASNLKEPEVVFVDGPKDFAKKFLPKGLLAKFKKVKSVWNEVWNEVGNEVGNEVWNEVRNEVWNEVRNEVGNEVRNEVRNEVWNEVRNEVRNEVWNEVRNEVWNEVGNAISWTSLAYDADFAAYYEYFKDIKAIKVSEKFNKYIGYLRAGAFYAVFFSKKAFVMRRPIKVEKDEGRRGHSLMGPAIEFADGTEIYKIHGVRFTKEQFKKAKKATVKELLGWDDIEQRSVLLRDKPLEQMLKNAKAKIINKTKKCGGYKLWEVDLGLRSKAKAMTYSGWSKGKDGKAKPYAKYVPNNSTNCLETIASLRGLTVEEFKSAIKS